jgi:hypothetical protein
MATANALEQSYLEHILIATKLRDHSAPFRTFFDNWFAFRQGGPFLNANSRPHWYNNPCPDKHGAALRRAHFVSQAAARTLGGVTRERLMKDHAIPVSILRDMLFQEHPRTVEDVRAFMLAHYRFGIITDAEDRRLNKAGLRSRMPNGWVNGESPFARYEAVGIAAQDLRTKPASAPNIELKQTKKRSLLSELLCSVTANAAKARTSG